MLLRQRSPVRPVTPKPFPIRGHHLEGLASVARGQSPRSVTREYTELYERLRRDAMRHPTLPMSRQDLAYYRDIYGDTEAQARQRQAGQREVFRAFGRLCVREPDYPAEILDSMPDMICRTNIFGEHCLSKCNPDGLQKRWDARYISYFGSIASRIGFADSVEQIQRIATFTDAPAAEVTCLATTLGTVQQVLSAPGVRWDRPTVSRVC
jgi:hypothetical protein